MVSAPTISSAGHGTIAGGSAESRCSWKWRYERGSFLSSTPAYFILSFALYASVAAVYTWLFLNPNNTRSTLPSFGCEEDGEGSWSVGFFQGSSPFSLKPIEALNIWKDDSAAWPVANPVVSCSLLSNAGFPSNFVADPFLHIQDGVYYLFYETKNPVTLQGDIGAAKSEDKGATWVPLGTVLDEDWHLSFPFVFSHEGQTYMMPEGSEKGDLRVYRAESFPLKWKLEKIVMKKPLVDSVIVNHKGMYWLLGSDHSGFGAQNNGQLEIYFSAGSPFGPWRPHMRNPIYNTDKSRGARNGGRPFTFEGNLYRVGQDSGETYGRRIRVFRVEVLSRSEFIEVEVEAPPGLRAGSNKGRNAWNGARHHHLDVREIGPGKWAAVTDGDRVPSGDPTRRFVLGWASYAAASLLVVLIGAAAGAVRCVVPPTWCAHDPGKRTDSLLERPLLSSSVKRLCGRANRAVSSVRSWVRPGTFSGRALLGSAALSAAALACAGAGLLHGGSGAHPSRDFRGTHSQFTMVAMTYDARLWNLKMYVRHYSTCASVREIVVVWNRGSPPPVPSDFDSAVPIRVRIEARNSLNNRFRVDPLIATRAVLQLDDDIMMTCGDLERAFHVWRRHPDRIVGFYPRLVDSGSPLRYRAERFARDRNGYNAVLTGAAFLDSTTAFPMYWGDAAAPGRDAVDRHFNCEDVLMNFLYANASSAQSVEYVRPSWTIDTSKFSGAAISGNTDAHYAIRSQCLREFTEMYGTSLLRRKCDFNTRDDGWDV